MKIFVGRFSEPVLGFESYGAGANASNNYVGEKNISPTSIKPLQSVYFSYSSLYLFNEEKILDVLFNWLYFVNESWLRRNKDDVFNYSFDNSPEFNSFVESAGFKDMDKIKLVNKEKNHLITTVDIPFSYIDSLMILRTCPGFHRACTYVRKELKPLDEIKLFKKNGFRSHTDSEIPKGIEFILK